MGRKYFGDGGEVVWGSEKARVECGGEVGRAGAWMEACWGGESRGESEGWKTERERVQTETDRQRQERERAREK
eukprot:871979-Rhodomonas_salina.1